ncbi:universal stress protein [Actinoplanes sp. TRM 88003]|uniref:Universal stress protein n=1 Tax=Paractinoplanes aksuensis TaxID=2939490 RepID=A0ABT1DLK7_9ACTN|nr:universal stress protein [Actinoplanes aksuensis]MCO8271722.1 universal stress protein [Actinoplanes aksuensis]
MDDDRGDVDGSPGSRKALTWAAAEAADHGADLLVLNVWEHTLLPPAGSVSVSERMAPEPSQATTDELIQVIKEER